MQRYNNSDNPERLSEDILCEMLEFLQFKIRTRRLSLTDAEALQRLFNGIEITGTASRFRPRKLSPFQRKHRYPAVQINRPEKP